MHLFGRKKEEPLPPENAPVPYANKDLQEIHQAVEPRPIFPTLSNEQVGERQGLPKMKMQEFRRDESEEETEEEPMEEMQPKQNFAPLFVKIDRYRNILNALGQVRTAMVMIHNSFAALSELEHARADTLKVLEKALDRVEKKIVNLDSELVKPAGYATKMPSEEYADAATIETTIADLRGQIDQLKSELDQVA